MAKTQIEIEITIPIVIIVDDDLPLKPDVRERLNSEQWTRQYQEYRTKAHAVVKRELRNKGVTLVSEAGSVVHIKNIGRHAATRYTYTLQKVKKIRN